MEALKNHPASREAPSTVDSQRLHVLSYTRTGITSGSPQSLQGTLGTAKLSLMGSATASRGSSHLLAPSMLTYGNRYRRHSKTTEDIKKWQRRKPIAVARAPKRTATTLWSGGVETSGLTIVQRTCARIEQLRMTDAESKSRPPPTTDRL